MTTAEVSLHEALQGAPENWEVRLALLDQLCQRSDWANVLQVLGEASVPPSNDGDLRKVVQICAQANSPGSAVPILKAYIQVKPSSAVAHYLYAKLLAKMGDMQRAREHYNTAVALNSELEDDALAAKLADLGETMAQSLPRSEVGALASLHKTGRIHPMPDRVQPGKAEQPDVAPPAPAPAPTPAPGPPPPSAIAPPVEQTTPEPTAPTVELSTPAPAPLTPPPGAQALHTASIPVSLTPDPVEETEEAGAEVEFDLATPDVVPGEESAPVAQVLAEGEGSDLQATRYLIVGEGEKVKPMEKKAETPQKLSAVMIAILVHVGVLFLLALVVMSIPERRPPEIVARAPAVLDEQVIQKEEIKKIVQRKPVQSAQTQMEVLTVAGASKVSMPDIQTDLTSFDPIGMGDSFGSSMSFDAGDDGGMVSFFGARSVSKRVVFAVDYSGSMKPMGKDTLMRKELAKSLESLPGGIEYQCIFFHGPAWYHGQTVDTKNPDKKEPWIHYIVEAERGNDKWKWYSGYDEKSRVKKGDKLQYVFHPATGSDKPEALPKGEYMSSSRSNIRKSVKIVEETPLGGGTDWRWPLYMAMNMEPDTIFFMTDGAFNARGSMLDDLLDYNRRKSRAKINTICMMVPQAMDQLTYLAEKSRGEVSLVLEDQTVLRGKELESYLKKNKK